MGPLVSQLQRERVHRYLEIGRHKDKARLLCGGKMLSEWGLADGYFYAPTIFQGTPDMTIAREEIFAPVAVLIKGKTFDEAMAVLNSTDYGLSGSIYRQEIRRAMRAVTDIQKCIYYINEHANGYDDYL